MKLEFLCMFFSAYQSLSLLQPCFSLSPKSKKYFFGYPNSTFWRFLFRFFLFLGLLTGTRIANIRWCCSQILTPILWRFLSVKTRWVNHYTIPMMFPRSSRYEVRCAHGRFAPRRIVFWCRTQLCVPAVSSATSLVFFFFSFRSAKGVQ